MLLSSAAHVRDNGSFCLLCITAALIWSGTATYAVDEDGDGMSDVWERLYGVPSSNAALDDDGDGMDNRAESTASTDPHYHGSALTANITRDAATGLATVTFPTPSARRYQLQFSIDLINWLNAGSVIMGSNDTASFSVAVSGSPQFFARVRLLPDETLPGRRFTAWEEYVLGVDPANPNVYPPFWTTTAFSRPWSHEADEGPNSFVDDGYGDGDLALQASRVGPSQRLTMGGREIQTAPSCGSYLIVQSPAAYKSKVYYKEFMQQPNPSTPYKPKWYLKSTLETWLDGGCPESAMGGKIVSIFDPATGGITDKPTGRPYSIPVSANTPDSPTHKKGEMALDNYDDPPNTELDCPGTGRASVTLENEYVTGRLISDTLAQLQPFDDDYYYSAGTEATAVKDLATDESSFYITKLRFRFAIYNYGSAVLPTTYTANWAVRFEPEGGSEAKYEVGTWHADFTDPDVQPYSDPVTIDPMTLNDGKDGAYTVCPLPVYVDVDYSPATDEGLVVTKGTSIHLRAMDYYSNGPTTFVPPGQPTWYRRQKQYDSSFDAWQLISGTGLEIDHTTPQAGIYEFKAVFTAGGKTAEAHFVREHGGLTPTSLPWGPPGEIDCVGVVDDPLQFDIRESARINLGSAAYAASTSYLPQYEAGSNKCNLFVYHKATDAGAAVPLINTSRSYQHYGQAYPPSANQWAGTESSSRFRFVTNIPNWDLQGLQQPPQPGWIAAHPSVPGNSGHTGIVDYDGYVIAAGSKDVNKRFKFLDGIGRTRRYSGPSPSP